MKTYEIHIDDETEKMLLNLSTATRCEPNRLIASIVQEVLADDAAAHPQTNVVAFPARR